MTIKLTIEFADPEAFVQLDHLGAYLMNDLGPSDPKTRVLFDIVSQVLTQLNTVCEHCGLPVIEYGEPLHGGDYWKHLYSDEQRCFPNTIAKPVPAENH